MEPIQYARKEFTDPTVSEFLRGLEEYVDHRISAAMECQSYDVQCGIAYSQEVMRLNLVGLLRIASNIDDGE